MSQEKEKKQAKKVSERVDIKRKIDALNILLAPYVTEKSISMIEKFNTLTFLVNKDATKTDIKMAVEHLYDVKVERVRTINTVDNKKKAFVRLKSEFKAQEIATRLGIL